MKKGLFLLFLFALLPGCAGEPVEQAPATAIFVRVTNDLKADAGSGDISLVHFKADSMPYSFADLVLAPGESSPWIDINGKKATSQLFKRCAVTYQKRVQSDPPAWSEEITQEAEELSGRLLFCKERHEIVIREPVEP